jgi:HSP20 family molecular chaperone IbpA
MSPLREALGELPGADLLEREDAYLLVVDAPGTTEETVDVAVEGGRLVIEARRRKAVPEGFSYRREGRPLFLDVELPLPPDVEGVAATSVDRGVLEIRLGKADGSE